MLKTFKFKQIIFRVLTTREEGIKGKHWYRDLTPVPGKETLLLYK